MLAGSLAGALLCRGVAQLAEHWSPKPKVECSTHSRDATTAVIVLLAGKLQAVRDRKLCAHFFWSGARAVKGRALETRWSSLDDTRVRIPATPPILTVIDILEGCRSGQTALPRKQLVPQGARAFESLAQHSGVLVLMVLCGSRMTTTRKLETAIVVRHAAAEAQQIAMQPIPKANAATWR